MNAFITAHVSLRPCLTDRYAVAQRNQKSCIAVGLVEHVMSQDPPGRFVECLMDEYYVVDYERAVEKTCQALREKKMQPPALFLEWEKQQQKEKSKRNTKDRELRRLKKEHEFSKIVAKPARKPGGKKTKRAASKKSRKTEDNHEERKAKKQKQSARKPSTTCETSSVTRPSSTPRSSAPTAEKSALQFVSGVDPSASYCMQLGLAELRSGQEVLASSQSAISNASSSSTTSVEITPFSKEADVAYILAGMRMRRQPYKQCT